MAINLNGSDTSSYTSPITLGADAPTSQGSTYYSTSVDIRRDDGGAVYNVFKNGSALGNRTLILNSDGSASFSQGNIALNLDGSAAFSGGIMTISNAGTLFTNNNGAQSYLLEATASGGMFSLYPASDSPTIQFNGNTGAASLAGTITTGTFNAGSNGTFGIELGVDGACSVQRLQSADSGSIVFRGLWGAQATTLITTKGDATFSGNVNGANTLLALDPNDPTKVLDVKESIRTVQAALYRLKAAVLIPDQTVNDLRLKILEALENISEVDE